MKEYMEGDDPNWENPTIEDIDNVPDMNQYEMGFDEDGEATISCEYDEAEAELHDDNKAFVHDFNENSAAAFEMSGQGVEGIDSTEIASAINDNDALLVAETEFAENNAQSMQDMSGTISDAKSFMAESDYLASRSEDKDDSTVDNSQLEGQIGFDGMGDQEPGSELSHQEFFDTQNAFEEEIMSGGSSDVEIFDNSGMDDLGGSNMDFSEE